MNKEKPSNTYLQIGGVRHQIVKCDNIHDNEAKVGFYDGFKCQILLKNTTHDRMVKTLFHEIMHAIVEEYDIAVENEEKFCNDMSTAMVELFPQYYLIFDELFGDKK